MSPRSDAVAAALEPWSTLPLSPEHATMLRASAISPEVASRRGYRTATSKAELAVAGFAASQRQVPTLLVPVCDVTGEVVLHQHRPDRPRLRNRKALKYETPARARMAVDVPPALDRVALNDPAVRLIITEGVKKADAAVSAGLACIALLGVWNWRGRNAHGGVAALADWDSIALKGRLIYVCFDSDVTTKREVQAALRRLRAFLVQRKARVRIVYLPPAADGGKQGLDDFLAAGGTAEQIEALAQDELREDVGAKNDDRPEIVITTEEHDVADAAVAALVREPGLYHRGGRLVACEWTAGTRRRRSSSPCHSRRSVSCWLRMRDWCGCASGRPTACAPSSSCRRTRRSSSSAPSTPAPRGRGRDTSWASPSTRRFAWTAACSKSPGTTRPRRYSTCRRPTIRRSRTTRPAITRSRRRGSCWTSSATSPLRETTIGRPGSPSC